MSFGADPDYVTQVLLADGWHYVDPHHDDDSVSSLMVDDEWFSFIETQSKVSYGGQNERHVVSGPLRSILAVRQDLAS